MKAPVPLVDLLQTFRLGCTPFVLCRSVRILPRVFRHEATVMYQWIVGLN